MVSSFSPIPSRTELEVVAPRDAVSPTTKVRSPIKRGRREESRLARELEAVDLRRMLDGREIARLLP